MRVLPAVVYDTLEFSCLAFNGIGAGSFFFGDAPLCYVGHLAAAQVIRGVATREPFGISEDMNDKAVAVINRRKKVNGAFRVSWPEFTRELQIVRGE